MDNYYQYSAYPVHLKNRNMTIDKPKSRFYKRNYLSLTVILFVLALSGGIQAQEDELKFEHLTIDDGLSQNKINCIFQDSRGFMWFGTNEGLNKYDGYEFTIFGKDSSHMGRLSDDWIQCILEDSKGNLWVGTGVGGLNLYDRATNSFIHYTTDSSSAIRLNSNNVKCIIEDSQGMLWMSTPGSLEMLDLKNKKTISYIPPHLKDSTTENNVISVIFEDSRNNLWFGTRGNGLGRFDRETGKFEYFRHDPGNPATISDNDVLYLYEDSHGKLWVGTYNGGLNMFDYASEKFQAFSPQPKVQENLTVQSIMEYSPGNLWIGTRNGLFLFNTLSHKFIHYAHDPHNPYSLNQDNIWSIFKDKKGDYWFGTKGGINFLNTANMAFVHYRADSRNNRHLNNKHINAIYEDRAGDIWFGTDGGGLNHLDRKTGIYTYYTHDPHNPYSLGSNSVSAIVEDPDGNFWVGTHQGGLNFFNRRTKRFINYTSRLNINQNYTSINTLFVDHNGDIWIAVGQSKGLFKYIRREKKIIPVSFGIEAPSPSFSCLFQDREGYIWAGTNVNQFFKIDPQNLSFESYRIPGGTENTIITNILEDSLSNMWLGTQGNGLIYYNTKEKSFRRYKQKDGLANKHTLGLLLDDNNDLWISTYNGLSRFDLKTKQFKNYYKGNGLQGNQFTTACLKTRAGELFFGGINGATAFFPDKIIDDSSLPPVVFTDFKIFNKSVKIGGENPILKKNIEDAREINLSYKHSVFTFTYAALDFSSSNKTQYAYMMEGFENDWNYVDKRRFATYTNLNPGSYTFKVKAAKNPGAWDNPVTSVNISVSPPFWEEWWFRLIIAAIVFMVIWHFVNHHKQKRNLLKATALANLTQLKLLRNQMNPHFLLNALSAIRALVLIDKNQAWHSVSELSDYFRYVLQNYNKVGAFLKDEIEAVNNYINIQSLLNESLNITFEIGESARECIVPAFLFQPLIENATKYGQVDDSGMLKIKVSLIYNNGILTIDISNTGQLRQQPPRATFTDNAHGNSIVNIKKRLEIMFKENYSFELTESGGWVHVKIIVNYKNDSFEKKLQAQALNEKANSLVS